MSKRNIPGCPRVVANRFEHWMQMHVHKEGLPVVITKEMIDIMNNSPNCCDINGWMESKLDLTDKQISFMQSSLDSLINLHGKPYGARYRHRTDGDPAPKPATHLEMRALNRLIASLRYKNINYQQISNVEFLLNALQSEIDSLSAALAAHHQLENCHGVDVLEIYRSITYFDSMEMEQWDMVDLPWPLNDVIMHLRKAHHGTSPRWRDADEANREFKDQTIALIQMLWLGVHPFR